MHLVGNDKSSTFAPAIERDAVQIEILKHHSYMKHDFPAGLGIGINRVSVPVQTGYQSIAADFDGARRNCLQLGQTSENG